MAERRYAVRQSITPLCLVDLATPEEALAQAFRAVLRRAVFNSVVPGPVERWVFDRPWRGALLVVPLDPDVELLPYPRHRLDGATAEGLDAITDLARAALADPPGYGNLAIEVRALLRDLR